MKDDNMELIIVLQEFRYNMSIYGWKLEDVGDGITVHTSRKPITIAKEALLEYGAEVCSKYCVAEFCNTSFNKTD